MKARKVLLWAGFVALGWMLCLPVQAKPAGKSLNVAGIVKGSTGEYFAIVRGHGMVRKGDTVPYATAEESGKILIVSIDRSEVKTKKIDVVKKEPEPEPEPVVAPKPRKVYEHRDPFWPVGHEPSA